MSPEQYENLIMFCRKVKEAAISIWERVKKALKTICGIWLKAPGYKRKAKAKLIAYYKSQVEGKSNNWRKMHSLPLARC